MGMKPGLVKTIRDSGILNKTELMNYLWVNGFQRIYFEDEIAINNLLSELRDDDRRKKSKT